jgi:hypothetical protein
MSNVTVVNTKNGAESSIPIETWNRIKNSPGWKGVFYIKEVIVPPEVARLRKSKKETKKGL